VGCEACFDEVDSVAADELDRFFFARERGNLCARG
jgi:hypothetical protein